jgi:hypothetical protein
VRSNVQLHFWLKGVRHMTYTWMKLSARTRRRCSLIAASASAACAGLVALQCGAVAFPPNAAAAPPGTTCGTVIDVPGRTQPVVVLKGDVDCPTAMRIANRYFHDPSVPQGDGSSAEATVEGWQCLIPVLPGRTHANSYAECDLAGSGFRMGT